MHRVLMRAKRIDEIDHWDGNGLNNRRKNLRHSTRSQNNANRHFSQSATGIKGVHLEAWTGRWRAEIECNKKRYKLGRFNTPEEAKAAYDAKARELFGEFAAT